MADPTHDPQEAHGGDPSMEDILASIRRILNEDEGAPHEGAPAHPATVPPEPDVMMLDSSMIVEHRPEPVPEPRPKPTHHAAAAETAGEHQGKPAAGPAMMDAAAIHVPAPEEPAHETPHETPHNLHQDPPAIPPPSRLGDLLAPASEAAAVSAVGSLLRTLTAERQTQVYRNGPTIEDLVREEIRPLLKSWLDQHLPPLVERLVRAEIERLVGKAVL